MNKGSSQWVQVNAAKPCLACGSPDWCAWTRSGKCLRCMRPGVSKRPASMQLVKKTEEHAIYTWCGPTPTLKVRRARPSHDESIDLAKMMDAGRRRITSQQLQKLANSTGIPLDVLREQLEPGWADTEMLRRLKASGAGWKERWPDGAFMFAERDGAGKLIGISLRTLDGRKGAASGKVGSHRGLIITPALTEFKGDVLIVEGATDVAACAAMGLPAVGRPSNSGGAELLAELLDGRSFVIVGENDQKPDGRWPGRDGARRVASMIAKALQRSVRWSLPPDDVKDVREFFTSQIRAGAPKKHAEALGQQFLKGIEPQMQIIDDAPTSESERLVRLALEQYRVGMSDEAGPFVVLKHGPNLCLPLRGSADALRARLTKLYRNRNRKTPSAQALSEALVALEGEAGEQPSEPVALRVARLAEKIIIDIGDMQGRAVSVSANGYEILERSPVLFRRTELTLPLPMPAQGGSLAELRRLIHVDDASWGVLVGWMIAALIPDIPYLIAMLGGEQGSGKTTAAKLIGSLIDPSCVPAHQQPRDSDAWALALNASWLVLIDNISSIPQWWSDLLCKAATGDAYLKRQLYKDSALTTYRFRRPVMLTSIDAGALRGDLGDRLALIEFARITPQDRLIDADVQQQFADMSPRVFGALLNALSAVLAALPTVSKTGLPRMADFGLVLRALDASLPEMTGGRAFDSFVNQGVRIACDVADADAVGVALQRFMVKRDRWSGTADQLLRLLQPFMEYHDRPRVPNRLAGRLNRLAPALLAKGYDVRFRKSGQRIITIEKMRVGSSQSPNLPKKAGDPGDKNRQPSKPTLWVKAKRR